MTPSPPTPRGLVPKLVGLFALGQLFFLPIANVLEFIPQQQTQDDVDPPIETTQHWGRFSRYDILQEPVETLGIACAGWGELTGQEQGWNMFTPSFPRNTVVPVIDLRFTDGTVERIPSRFDPLVYPPAAMRMPLRYDREFNYEANIFMLAWQMNPEQPEAKLPRLVRENSDLILRYLVWKGKGRGAEDVVLSLRFLPIPNREPVHELPLARWRPNQAPRPGILKVEAYYPAFKGFIPMKEWGVEYVPLREWDAP